jgi:hypothetical protein
MSTIDQGAFERSRQNNSIDDNDDVSIIQTNSKENNKETEFNKYEEHNAKRNKNQTIRDH